MNCKPGDLAVIVKTAAGFSRWVGRVVTVIEPTGALNEPAWRIDPHPTNEVGGEVFAEDRALRAIRDNDGTDETLIYAGLPLKETA